MKTNIFHDINDIISRRNMRKIVMQYRQVCILLFQIVISVLSLLAAYNIRFDFNIPTLELPLFYKSLPLLIISRIIANYYFNIHSGSWQYVSMRDLMDTMKAVLSGSIVFMIMMVFIYRIEEFPRSVFILEGLINIALIGGSRFFIRYYSEIHSRQAVKISKCVLIVGAGKAGVLMLNEIRNHGSLGIQVVGFVDDNPYKKGINIQGVPVLGDTEAIPRLAKEYSIDEIMIAIPSASYKDIVRITEIAETVQVKTLVLPNMAKLFNGNSVTSQLRDVSYNDLLGRKIIKFSRDSDRKHMEDEIKDKAVLVTGAGGSIGSELCRQVLQLGPRILILYERHENALFEIELELRKEFRDKKILPVIGDILDGEKFGKILKANSVDLIYHAAAYKHVPMMEREPIEAVRNNIMGTMNVAKVALENKVDKFVMISTDKAVNPANIMGTTKRVAELIIQGLNGNGTKFVAVRFGNVIGSNGSVIPRFKKQIAEGGPITVTHADITRYFMLIEEAVQLVMTAGTMGEGGEIFLLDMGSPVKIVDLAKDLIRRSGLEPGKDIDIIITGLRPGEKLYEELYWRGEGIVSTTNKKITMIKQNGENYARIFDKVKLMDLEARERNVSAVMNMLKDLVPESTIKCDDMAHDRLEPIYY